MSDVIEVSYTGDLLSHRRCPRAWAYEKHVGMHPYEQVQAMEGHLIHHAMEWLTKQHRESGAHVSREALKSQLGEYFRVLWGRGIRTTFRSRDEVITAVADHLYPDGATPARGSRRRRGRAPRGVPAAQRPPGLPPNASAGNRGSCSPGCSTS